MLTASHSRIKRNKRILKKNPASKEARVNLGLLYFKNKRYDKALEHLTEAQALAGEDLSIKKMLAVVYLANKNFGDAKEILHQILEKDPEDADANQQLSTVYVHENDYPNAVEFLKKAAGLRENDAEIWNDLGALAYALEDMESAKTYFSKAIETDDGYVLSYLNLMDVYLREKNTGEALRVCRSLVKRFPDDPAGFKYRGMIARMDGHFSEAIGYLSLARKQVKDDPEISYHLGLCLMSVGDFESGAKAFRNTLEIDPEYPKARKKLIACYCKLEGAHNAFRLLKDEINEVGWKAGKRHLRKQKKQPVALSILVPAFNEAQRILTNTRKIRRWAAALGKRFEIIVVDDGSEDDTYEILELLSRNIKQVRPYRSPSNKGKGMALREAALKAQGDLVVFLDADLELHPSLLPEMIRRMEESGADMVLGSKRHPQSKVNYPWHRKLLSTAYYLVNRLLFGIPVKDTQTGIKVFKKAVLDDVIPRLIEKQYAFDLELIVNAHARGYRIIEAPIELNYSRGFGRIGGHAVIRTAVDTLAIFYRLRVLKYYDRKRLPLLKYPKISIVVPFKEIGPHARQCLQHCKKIDYPEFEIILLPDGPIAEDTDPRVKVIPTGPVGPSEKRDRAAKEASGEILAFIDDDAYPPADWLQKLARNFSDEQVSAVGGPGVTPQEDNFWQQLSGAVFSSRLVSGAYRYRYVPKTFQEIDDFPSCNLAVRKQDFEAVGGFKTAFWPGEDTIFCLKIVKDLGKKIVYDPDAVVYHHRRELFKPHLVQVKRYGLHRGFFVKRFPETSFKPGYFMPSLVVLGVTGGLALALWFPAFRPVYLWSVVAYLVLCSSSQWLTLSPKRILVGLAGVALTHLTYGIYFLKGLFSGRIA